MSEQIKFDKKYYPEVVDYLNNCKNLHAKAGFNGEGRIYLTNNKEITGFILQKSCKGDEGIISVLKEHTSFDKIKKGLNEIINRK